MRVCVCVCVCYNYLCIIVKLVTVVDGDPKAPFSITTTPRGREGCYSFPWIIHFILDPNLIMLCVKQGSIKCHFFFCIFDMTWPGIEPQYFKFRLWNYEKECSLYIICINFFFFFFLLEFVIAKFNISIFYPVHRLKIKISLD